MSSLASSLGTTCSLQSLTKNHRSSPPTRNLNTKESSSFRLCSTNLRRHGPAVQRLQVLNEKPNGKAKESGSLGRREAIGFGVSFGVLEGLFQLSGHGTTSAAEGNGPCEFTVAPSGLAFCDKVVGYGAEAVQGQLIKAHYIGKLENGKVFDSSYNRGKPLTFRVGVGEVIKGWDQGIIGGDGIPPMLAGGKRTLKIPPELGYGVRGAGCRGGSCIIPPNSVLLFDVEFIGKA